MLGCGGVRGRCDDGCVCVGIDLNCCGGVRCGLRCGDDEECERGGVFGGGVVGEVFVRGEREDGCVVVVCDWGEWGEWGCDIGGVCVVGGV